jgi:hypothetical protein
MRQPLISRSSRFVSAGCSQGPWNGSVLSLRRIPKLETDPLSTYASDTFPAPTSLATEICSGLAFAYPAGKGSEAIRRTMLPNSRRLIEKALVQDHRLVARPAQGARQQFGDAPFQNVVRGNADGILHATPFQRLVNLRLGEGGISAEHYLFAQPLLPLDFGQQ